ncbi:hypothetical protein [Kocuria palustris]|uniref:hypothetical protein n=2 Tax=Kocuria TaxID=57493 RepID=UPI003CF71492
MSVLQPYRRGFLLHQGDAERGTPDEWQHLRLSDSGWSLSYDARLDVELAAVEDGRRWVLVLGLCLYAGDDHRELSPARRLADALSRSVTDLLDVLDVLGGRHVVLTGDGEDIVVRHDAMGLRSVCFSPSAGMVSSHPHLIHDLVPHAHRTSRNGRDSVLSSWSRTPYLGIEALLPNHELRVPGWTLHRYYPREPNRFAELSDAQRMKVFRRRWDRQMAQLVRRPEKLMMSLTGGADSRTSLALSWEHRHELAMFTCTAVDQPGHPRRESLAMDKRIVDRLLNVLPGIDHTYFPLEDSSDCPTQEQESVLQRSTYGRHGARLLPHDLQEFGSAEHIHLSSLGFKVGRASWGATEENDTAESLERFSLRQISRSGTPESTAALRELFQRGFRRWKFDADLHGLHLRDLYFWEMRMGRWASEIMNETDLVFETCVPLNVRSLLEITLALPLEQRRSGHLFAELINDAAPLLNFFGKSDDRNLYEITRDEAHGVQGPDATDSDAPALESSTWLREPGGEPQTQASAEGPLLSIPTQGFREGHSSVRRFGPLRRAGELRFAVTSAYGSRRAVDHWRLQVLVDGRPHVSWDGGGSRTTVHVRVANLSAGARVSVAAVALRDHRGTSSWSKASRAWVRDVEFSAMEPTGPVVAAADAPDASRTELDAQPPSIDARDVPSLSPELFPLDSPTRLDIRVEDRRVPLLVVRRAQDGAPRVLTLFNGAVDLDRSRGEPVFQRSTWCQDLPWTQIYVADPGSLGPEALGLSWGQISASTSVVPGTARAIRMLAGVLGAAAPCQRRYFGSSAGGFWAWSAAVLDDGSHAVVNNAQLDWTRWMAPAVNDLRHSRFGGATPAEIRRRHPTRTSVLRLWESTGSASTIDYWVNIASKHDRAVDLPQAEKFAAEHPELAPQLRIRRYEDADAGHNPLGRDATVRALLLESESAS